MDKLKIGENEPKPSFKYEEVTDLSVSEKAKAMIGGEVFYSRNGEYECFWDAINGAFFTRRTDGTAKNDFVSISGTHHRKIETQWHEKLDGTIENAVVCWVSDTNQQIRGNIEIISGKDKCGYKRHGPIETHWKHATPFSKDELAVLTANAPGANNGSKSI